MRCIICLQIHALISQKVGAHTLWQNRQEPVSWFEFMHTRTDHYPRPECEVRKSCSAAVPTVSPTFTEEKNELCSVNMCASKLWYNSSLRFEKKSRFHESILFLYQTTANTTNHFFCFLRKQDSWRKIKDSEIFLKTSTLQLWHHTQSVLFFHPFKLKWRRFSKRRISHLEAYLWSWQK